jgi:hypothetical protein
MARAVDVPFTNNSADHRRALQPGFERCATPLTMGTAICFTPSTRVRGGVPLGAPTRLSCAAAGVSSGLAGAVKAAMIKSKLYKIEASTVPTPIVRVRERCSSSRAAARFVFSARFRFLCVVLFNNWQKTNRRRLAGASFVAGYAYGFT